MICPNCGTNLPDEARFCHECGIQLNLAPHVPGAADADDPTTNTEQASTKRRKVWPFVAIAAVLLAVFIGAAAFAFSSLSRERNASSATLHPVTFRVSIPSYGEGSSRIPVSISGTDANGDEVDKLVFLAYSGVDTQLMEGTYHVKVMASPLAADGTIYDVAVSAINLTLGDDLAAGEAYEMPDNLAFVFSPIEPADVTDEQIDEALEWARKDENSTVDLTALEEAARARRDNATQPTEDANDQQGEPSAQEPESEPSQDQAAEHQEAIDAAKAAGNQVLTGTVRVMTGYEIGEAYGFDAEAAVGSDAAASWVLLVFDNNQDVVGANGDGVGTRSESIDRIRLPQELALSNGKQVTVAVGDVWYASDTVGLIAPAGAGYAEVLF